MKKNELMEMLKTDVLTIEFLKSNGSRRVIKATLKADIAPAHNVREEGDNLVTVYSVDDVGWRSIRIDSIVKAAAPTV